MRVAKKEISDKGTIERLLTECPVGRLGTIGQDGFPVVKPLNFVYHEGGIYFHSALQGEKMRDIERSDRVCFEVDVPIMFVKGLDSPCKAAYLYQSVIVRGRARTIDERGERLRALEALMEKYQPEGGYGTFVEEKLALTAVVRIDIVEMTGKQDLGRQGS